jgi:hemolysin activation/secretion protein
MRSTKQTFTMALCVAAALQGPQSFPATGQDFSSVIHTSSTHQPADVAILPLKRPPPTILPVAPSPSGPQSSDKTQGTFLLKQVVVSGNTRISINEISSITDVYIGKRVAVEDLSRMRDEITQLYISRGYITSGATLPPQDASLGAIRVKITEGTLADILVEGTEQLDDSYVVSRFGVTPASIVNIRDYEERFRELLDDTAIREVHADLRPGKAPGSASLLLSVKEADPFSIQANIANDRSPSVGGTRASIETSMRNTAYSGDHLKFEFGITEGTHDASASYSVPIETDGTLISASIDYAHSKAIEDPLNELDIVNESITLNAGVLFPIFRENSEEISEKLNLSAALVYQVSDSYLAGIPFSFSPGAVDGQTEYLSGVLGTQYQARSTDTVLALGAELKAGLYALEGGSSTSVTPDPHYWMISANSYLAHQIDTSGLQIKLRMQGQYTDEPLFVPDRFAAGGLNSVRGYRKNRGVSDFGILASWELQKPILSSGVSGTSRSKDISVLAFVDLAHFWNASPFSPDVDRMAGAGVAVEWTPTDWVNTRVTFAKALNELPEVSEKDIQDQGIYLQMSIKPLSLF